MRGTAGSALLLGVLWLLCGASSTGAVAAAGHNRGHHSSRARACHRTRHRRCPPSRSRRRSARRHTRRRASKPAKPKVVSEPPGSGSPWATVPGTVGPTPSPGSTAAPSGPAGTPPGESPATPVAPAHVEVTAEDTEAFRFVLSRPTVPAGTVIIEFVNHGQDEHNLNALEPTEGSLAGSIGNTAPNAHPNITVDLRHGSYTLFCSLPGHEAKGMKATLLVE